MLFVIYRLDKPASSDLRVRLRPDYRTYVASLAGDVWADGPLLGADGDEIGNMLILDAASAGEAAAVAARDPCSAAGLYETTRIHPWHARVQSPAGVSGAGAKRRVISDEVNEPPPELWSNCLLAGNVAYISGMTARGADWESIEGLDAYEQSRIIFGKIRSVIAAAGGSMAEIVKLTVFVTDIADRENVWRARKEFFSGDFPACSLIGVKALALPAMKVEIEAVAHLSIV